MRTSKKENMPADGQICTRKLVKELLLHDRPEGYQKALKMFYQTTLIYEDLDTDEKSGLTMTYNALNDFFGTLEHSEL